MGENSRKGLYIATGVFFAILIISIGINYFLKAQPVMEKSSNKIDSVTAQLDSIEYKLFDGRPVSGSEVISAINTKASSNITVKVKTSANPSGKSYNSGSYNIKDIHHKDYIEATASFESQLEKTDNGTVTGITFEQE